MGGEEESQAGGAARNLFGKGSFLYYLCPLEK
jgi:hypothetical protein